MSLTKETLKSKDTQFAAVKLPKCHWLKFSVFSSGVKRYGNLIQQKISFTLLDCNFQYCGLRRGVVGSERFSRFPSQHSLMSSDKFVPKSIVPIVAVRKERDLGEWVWTPNLSSLCFQGFLTKDLAGLVILLTHVFTNYASIQKPLGDRLKIQA